MRTKLVGRAHSSRDCATPHCGDLPGACFAGGAANTAASVCLLLLHVLKLLDRLDRRLHRFMLRLLPAESLLLCARWARGQQDPFIHVIA